MQTFSPQQRAALGNYGSIIDREARRSSRSKQNNTRQSRKLHFLKFSQSVHVQDPCLPSGCQQARNYFVACYLVSLILGNTIKSIQVKHRTLQKYIAEATKFYTDRKFPSPQAGVKDDLVKPLLQAVKAYESQTNRKEMIYDNMLAHMLKTCSLAHPDSLDAALLDWIILGRYTGARRSEWCQDSQTVEMTTPNLAHEVPEPKAFIAADFEFFDSSRHLIHDVSSSSTSLVAYVRIRWRYQKNGDNGQQISFKKDHERPDVCPVSAALRIFQRAHRLQVPSGTPIAVYSSSSSTFRYITAKQVVAFLRRSAQVAFNLRPDDKSLNRWTCHSIRVTAANLLHRAKMSDSYIQTRLRWKSNTFLMYLRNTFYSADEHTKALDISNCNLPPLDTPDGLRYRPLERHEEIISSYNVPVLTAH